MKKLKERKEELVQERGQQESSLRDIQLIQKTLQTAVQNVDSILSMEQITERTIPGKTVSMEQELCLLLCDQSIVSSHFFCRGASFFLSKTAPGAGTGILFNRLILRCSFLDSFRNSFSADFFSLLFTLPIRTPLIVNVHKQVYSTTIRYISIAAIPS